MKRTGKLQSLPASKETVTQRREKREMAARAGLPVIRTFKLAQNPREIQPKKESIAMQERLNKERLQEVRFKRLSRNLSIVFFGMLLIIQNSAIFYIVYSALRLSKLQDLQAVFSLLVGATLTETYLIAKKIIDFVFSSTDYKYASETDKKIDEH